MKLKKTISLFAVTVMIITTLLAICITTFGASELTFEEVLDSLQSIKEDQALDGSESADSENALWDELQSALREAGFSGNDTDPAEEELTALETFFDENTLSEISQTVTEEMGSMGECRVYTEDGNLIYEYIYNLANNDDTKIALEQSFQDIVDEQENVIEILQVCLDNCKGKPSDDAKIVWICKDMTGNELFRSESLIYRSE